MKKITFYLSTILIIILSRQVTAQNTIDKRILAGSWMGKLSVSGVTLRIVYNLSLIEKDSITATLDSPDQGAKNIKIGPVTLNGKDIKILAPVLMAEYSGTFVNDTLIDGSFKQADMTFPLSLTKLTVPITFKRPQEPLPPFQYISEDVAFTNDRFNINLAGTLTIPKGEGPFPAVILITGSGAQNRNEEVFGHKPFMVIADHLTRNGIAVLRYDDRGIGKSEGNYSTATSADFATDAEAAFKFLKTNQKINSKLIGLTGHSEGGIIAPMVAAANREVAFIISLAGTGVRGDKVLHRQNKDLGLASGIAEADVMKSISINKKLFAVVRKEADDKKALEKMTSVYKKELAKEESSPEEINKELERFRQSSQAVVSHWFRYFMRTDPSLYWKKVKCPVLALNGEKDLQVAADVNLPAIEKALGSGGNRLIKTIAFPDLNHLFQHCKTGTIAEYNGIEETFSPEVMKIMTEWILGLR